MGKTTSADSLYMELRSIPVPSGKGFLNIPTKVYRNRPRGHNVPYVPDIPCNNDTINIWRALIMKPVNRKNT